MTEKRTILELDDNGRKHLDEIFRGRWYIFNPTKLEISGIGKLVATSMVLDYVEEGHIYKHFSFEQGRTRGDIIKIGENYFIERRKNKK